MGIGRIAGVSQKIRTIHLLHHCILALMLSLVFTGMAQAVARKPACQILVVKRANKVQEELGEGARVEAAAHTAVYDAFTKATDVTGRRAPSQAKVEKLVVSPFRFLKKR